MAIRRPLKVDSGNLKDLSSAEMDLIIDEIIRQYGLSPSVDLTINQGNGNLTTLTETRAVAGDLASGSTPWPTAGPSGTVSVNYDNTVQTITNQTIPYRTGTVYENYSYPVYRTATNDLQAMTAIDMIDTFMSPAITKLVLGSTTSEAQAGTFFISTNESETDATKIGSLPVAADTNADTIAFGSGSLPEAIDQSTSVSNFWLHRINPVDGVSFITPVGIKRDTNDLISTPRSNFGTMVQDLIKYHAATTLRYNYYISTDTSFGSSRGTGITDTFTSEFTTRYEQPSASTYYAQNVPSGTPTVQSTHFLRVGTI
jgi:hypothetical protein